MITKYTPHLPGLTGCVDIVLEYHSCHLARSCICLLFAKFGCEGEQIGGIILLLKLLKLYLCLLPGMSVG